MKALFYRPQTGYLAVIHPSIAILATIGLFVPPFFTEDPLAQAVYLGLLFLPLVWARGLGNLWRIKGLALTIFFITLFLWTITLPGQTTLLQFGPVAIFQESLLTALARALKLLGFLVAGVTFLTIVSVEMFAYGLRGLGLPYRACFTVTLAFRLTPLFMETGEQIANAQRTRGLELDSGGPLKRARRFIPLFIPVLVSGFRQADGLAVALESKGFSLPGQRTNFLDFTISWRDTLLLLLVILLNIATYYWFTYYSLSASWAALLQRF